MKKIAYILLIAVLAACDPYKDALTSGDLDYKMEVAKKFYNQGSYEKALPLFDELLELYRGTTKAQDVYYYYAMCLYEMDDYILAAYHFKNMYQTFPGHVEANDAAFMVAFCYYLESPKSSLDQAYTFKAMNEFQLFINTHPGSERIEECNILMDEMRAKLEKKSFEIARVYHRTQKYQAAVIAFNHTLNDYPGTKYRELSMFYKLEAAYELAQNSIETKQLQRYKEARTAYYELIDSFPETEFKRNAERLFEMIQEEINTFNLKA